MTKFKNFSSKNQASASGRQLVALPAVSVTEATAALAAFGSSSAGGKLSQ